MISTNNKKRKSSFNRFVGWLETGFSTFHLSSTRTNQRTCCINLVMWRLMQQVRDQVFDKKSGKRVESMSKAFRKPARTCRKPGCKPGRKPCLEPGLQLVRIMDVALSQYVIVSALLVFRDAELTNCTQWTVHLWRWGWFWVHVVNGRCFERFSKTYFNLIKSQHWREMTRNFIQGIGLTSLISSVVLVT